MATSIANALIHGEQLRASSDTWRLDTEILLAAILGCQREYLYTWPERLLSAKQQDEFHRALQRRKQGEPIAYITGCKAFWDFELTVSPDVLIPRPETELIVEVALEILTDRSTRMHIADLGTGSGAIALALARQSQSWRITATDISAAALAMAQHNAGRLQLENIEFQLTSWCEGLAQHHYDLIVCNPPYVAGGDKHLSQGDVRFEPIRALLAVDNGLKDIKQIAGASTVCLKQDAWLLVEHGYDQGAAVADILRNNGFSNISCRVDLAGLDRMTMAQVSQQNIIG